MTAPRTYGVRDALMGLFVGLWLVVLPGYGLYALAPEVLQCTRADGGSPTCQLTRRIAWMPARSTTLVGVSGATLADSYSSPKYTQGRRSEGGHTFWVQYDTAAGPVDGTGSASRQAHETVIDGLRAFLQDARAKSFEAALPGGPLIWRLALWVLLVVGALCLINIPFATVRALRGLPPHG